MGGSSNVPGYDLLEEREGRGAIRVFRARDLASGRLCELDLLSLGADPTAGDRQLRFLDEGRGLLDFQHPNVVRTLDVGSGPESAWIVHEALEGVSLEQVLAVQGQRLGVMEALAVGVQVGAALGALGDPDDERIHRDVRPGCVVVGPDGQARLGGFGLNVESSYERLQEGAMPEGGVDFLSPEQVEGDVPPTPRTDVYGLGATLYRCLTGRVPHGGATLFTRLRAIAHAGPPDVRELRPEVPDPVALLLQRFMEWDPDDRPLAQDVAPLIEAVAEGLGYASGWEQRALAELYVEVSGQIEAEASDRAILVRLRGTGRTLDLRLGVGDELEVGRAHDADLSLKHGWISRKHAVLAWTGSALVLTDLGSANGTSVNDVKVEGSVELNSGDLVAFGKSRFEVLLLPVEQLGGRGCAQCGAALSDDEEAEEEVCLRCQARGDADREAAEHRLRRALEEARFEVVERLPVSGVFRRYRVRRRAKMFLASVIELGQRTASLYVEASDRALSVKHPGVLPALDLEVRAGILIVLAESPPGRTLEELLAEQGPLPPEETVSLGQLLCEVLDGLEAQGLRPLVRPELVFLGDDGQPRLLDVGLAPALLQAGLHPQGWAPQPVYEAPELEHAEGLDPGGVVYSVGATLSYALTGNPVAEARGGQRHDHLPLTMVAQVPPPLAELLSRCTAPDPAARPASPADLRDELVALLRRRWGVSDEGRVPAPDEATWPSGEWLPEPPDVEPGPGGGTRRW
jgi:serine/threonine-protein kinase